MNLLSYFSLYANCIPVRGTSRSVLYDLHKRDFNFIPNDLYEILRKYNKMQFRSVFDATSPEFHEILIEYFDFLTDNDYIFISDSFEELNCFPEMDLSWDRPAIITNAIVDFNSGPYSLDVYHTVFVELEELGCHNIELRFFPGFELELAQSIFNLLEKFDFNTELLIAHSQGIVPDYYLDLFKQVSKISKVTVFGFDQPLSDEFLAGHFPFRHFLSFTKEIVYDQSHCGVISPHFFSVNLETFTESLGFNSCLNRKIGIDGDGNIKNCPSMTRSYGNINNTHLSDVVKQEEFTRYWLIKKDLIETCKVCEFRYMCTDCRAYVDDFNQKPYKCSYNPMTCEW